MSKKKKILIAFGVLFVIGLIGMPFNSNKNSTTTSNAKQEEKKIDIDFNKEDPTSEKFNKAIKTNYKDTKISYNKENGYLGITLNGNNDIDGKYSVRDTALKGSLFLKEFGKNPKIKGINIEREMKVVDDKGNESTAPVVQSSFTKEIINEINFDNWTSLLRQKNFYTKYYTTADTFLIYPTIRNEMPQVDIDNIYVK